MPNSLKAPPHLFAGHREVLLERLRSERCAALLLSAEQTYRSPELPERFRQSSDFWYLTGLDEPDAALLLLPEREAARSILFLRPRDPAEERWSGARCGLADALNSLGFEEARSIDALWADLPELLAGVRRLVLPTDLPASSAARLELLLRNRSGAGELERLEPSAFLLEQRLAKGLSEQALLRRAAEISAAAHLDAMRHLGQCRFEAEVEGRVLWNFRRAGAREAYPTMVASGDQAGVLHYLRNDRALAPGSLLVLDAGAQVDGYACDMTRTMPVDGRFDGPQRALYSAVFKIQEQLLSQLRPGLSVGAVEELAARLQIEQLLALGLLSGSPEALLESGQRRRFMRHRALHFVGLDVHDGGRQALQPDRRLEAGMVLAIEPGLYVDAHELSAPATWRGLAARLEDVLLLTAKGVDLWTHGAPRHPDDVEAACQLSELGPR